MTDRFSERTGCLPLLFGLGGRKAQSGPDGTSRTSASEEGNYHSGPGGYEGMGYSDGYASDYLAEQENLDNGGREGEA